MLPSKRVRNSEAFGGFRGTTFDGEADILRHRL
jgi:hypothetical protein